MVGSALKQSSTVRHVVTEANCGAEGLALLREDPTRFDVVVLDYRLSDMDAIQFLDQLVGEARVPPVPIVMLTGSFERSLPFEDPLRSGVQDFFSKSDVTPQLLSRITSNAIERHKLLQRLDRSERDATEAQEAADQARIAAETANTSKSRFLAMISHELRTPLTAIRGFADLLLADPNGEDADEMLKMMSSSGAHLSELLDDLIDMAKVEANTLDLEVTQCDVESTIRETCELMSIRARDKGLSLRYVPSDQNCVIETDPIRLRQVIVNLLGNAIKFTDDGEVVCEFTKATGPDLFRVRVRDSGPGIDNDLVDSLFTAFVQGRHGGAKRQGIGLGLAISKHLAQMLGGDLVVESTSPSGTVFCFTFDSMPGKSNGQRRVGVHPVVELKGPPNLAGARVLIAEDTAANRFLLRKLLEPTQAELHFAENGREAVEAASSGGAFSSPDLILMDMLMPEMDGYAATAELRRRRLQAPIVALTAATSGSDQSRCLESGCDDVVTKPIHVAKLYATLQQRLLAK